MIGCTQVAVVGDPANQKLPHRLAPTGSVAQREGLDKMNTSTGNSRQMARSPEDMIFGAADKVDRLRERVLDLKGEVSFLRNLVMEVSTGARAPGDALRILGMGESQSAAWAAHLPTQEEAIQAKIDMHEQLSRRNPVTGEVVYYIDRGGLVKGVRAPPAVLPPPDRAPLRAVPGGRRPAGPHACPPRREPRPVGIRHRDCRLTVPSCGSRRS